MSCGGIGWFLQTLFDMELTMRSLITVAVFGVLFSNIVYSEVDCTTYGRYTNCNNGISAVSTDGYQSSTTQLSNGSSAYTSIGPDGNSRTTYSNGVNSNTVQNGYGGSSTYFSNGVICRTHSSGQTTCN